jgi:hypothetical protein
MKKLLILRLFSLNKPLFRTISCVCEVCNYATKDFCDIGIGILSFQSIDCPYHLLLPLLAVSTGGIYNKLEIVDCLKYSICLLRCLSISQSTFNDSVWLRVWNTVEKNICHQKQGLWFKLLILWSSLKPVLDYATAVNRGVLYKTRGMPSSYLRTYLLSWHFSSAIHAFNKFIYSIKCYNNTCQYMSSRQLPREVIQIFFIVIFLALIE